MLRSLLRAFATAAFAYFFVGCDSGEVTSTTSSPPRSCASTGDDDSDEICNDIDNCPNTHNPDQYDLDSDGIGNACDPDSVCAGLGGDDDGDNVCQSFDNCPMTKNSSQEDSDSDGVGDACDATDSSCDPVGGDTDGDGVCNPYDNCVGTENVDQLDSDGDGLGDACDSFNGPNVCAGNGGDDDDDNVCQSIDNCPDTANSDQKDQDGDGLGDACDPTPKLCDDFGGDQDGDTICTQFDNCPDINNFNQVDLDSDGVGDVCDPNPPSSSSDPPCVGLGGDNDNDNFCNFYDNCPTVANPTQSDKDADGLGDACDIETCDGIDNNGNGQTDEAFSDADNDGVADCVDPCPNQSAVDADNDGVDDCIDPCPNDALNDIDGDNICGDVDNCPGVAGSNQSDKDNDGIGDICDVEECDGISNDADTQIDEGLPDTDGDGICNEIDPCPTDPQNDLDQDMICGNVDNCPANSNNDQADADNDGVGDICDLSSPVGCSASATLNMPGAVPLPTNLVIGDAIADPLANRIYVVVRSTSPAHANELLAVDPTTPTGPSIAWSIVVGSDPRVIAIAQNGSVAYVGLWGAASIRAINIPLRRACFVFPVGNDPYYGALRAGDMDVLPSFPETIVVSTRATSVSPDFRSVRVYDYGAPRPLQTPGHTGARMITLATDQTVYGYNNSSTEYGFRKLSISSAGITEDWKVENIISGFSTDIIYQGGKVFASNGVIINPTLPMLLATLPVTSTVTAADAALAEAYYASTSATVAVYDTNSYLLERNVTMTGNGTGSPIRLLRWGMNGLAIITANGITISANGAGP